MMISDWRKSSNSQFIWYLVLIDQIYSYWDMKFPWISEFPCLRNPAFSISGRVGRDM